jgi:hypothetical protein
MDGARTMHDSTSSQCPADRKINKTGIYGSNTVLPGCEDANLEANNDDVPAVVRKGRVVLSRL